MIENYNDFIKLITEAKVAPVINRAELKIGDKVMTNGEFDGINLDYQTGKIIFMREYGNLLIEFDKSNKKFHAGFKDVGEKGHCFYVPLKNISSNKPEEFEKIIKKHEEEEKNKNERMKAKYKIGDVIVGIDKIKNNGYGSRVPLDVSDEVGIVYYSYDANSYWVGFLDKFDPSLRADQDGYPKNGAGLILPKLNMRHADPDEIKKFEKEINEIQKNLDKLGEIFEIGEVVIVDGNYNGLPFKNNVGIIRDFNTGRLAKTYTIQFIDKFDHRLFDVNYMIGSPTGYQVTQGYIRKATEDEIKENQTKIDLVKKEVDEFNYDYKIGDFIVVRNIQNIGISEMEGQIGEIIKINGSKPRDYFDVNFLFKFNEYLRKNGKFDNVYQNLHRINIGTIEGDGSDIKRKIEEREIMPYATSDALGMLLNRINLKPKSIFLTNSYFDIDKEKNDIISYIPIDRYRRLEKGDDPYKSKLRQQMKIGKFFRVLNDKFTDKDVEGFINSFRANYDVFVKGVSDQLKLVSGEDVRFWYNGENYVKGGGMLNSSCMQGSNKGPEMQMFVDNPDVIQLLILRDPVSLKLLGRALVWRLAEPEGKTFMDYIYTRHDKDRQLFMMYGAKNGWIMRDKGNYGNMICALHTDKKYHQGRNALDHFDTFHLVPDQNYLTNGNSGKYKNPYMVKGAVPGPPPEDVVKTEDKPVAEKMKKVITECKFKEGDKIIYKKEKSPYNGKTGVFFKVREDGKYSIVFDEDKHKFATHAKNVFPYTEEKKEA